MLKGKVAIVTEEPCGIGLATVENFWRITLLWLWPAPGRKPPNKAVAQRGNATQTPRLWALPRTCRIPPLWKPLSNR